MKFNGCPDYCARVCHSTNFTVDSSRSSINNKESLACRRYHVLSKKTLKKFLSVKILVICLVWYLSRLLVYWDSPILLVLLVRLSPHRLLFLLYLKGSNTLRNVLLKINFSSTCQQIQKQDVFFVLCRCVDIVTVGRLTWIKR